VHVDEDDSFLVQHGTLSLVVGDDARDVRAEAGTFVLVPAGTPHAIRNDGPDAVRLLNVHAPGGFDRRIGLR
jgi:mannose-6-phosphate isomerase-like protein (cupin superfamily)